MKKLKEKVIKWFDLNIGWMFINGRKEEKWIKYLKDKYGDK
jgi:hypothetical protein